MAPFKVPFTLKTGLLNRQTKLRTLILCSPSTGIEAAPYGYPRLQAPRAAVTTTCAITFPLERNVDAASHMEAYRALCDKRVNAVDRREGKHVPDNDGRSFIISGARCAGVLDDKNHYSGRDGRAQNSREQTEAFLVQLQRSQDAPTGRLQLVDRTHNVRSVGDATEEWARQFSIQPTRDCCSSAPDLAEDAALRWFLLGIHPDATYGRIELEGDGSPVLKQFFEDPKCHSDL